MLLEAVVVGIVILNVYLLFLWRDLDKKMDFILNSLEIVTEEDDDEVRNV
jgi:hypothetical protein